MPMVFHIVPSHIIPLTISFKLIRGAVCIELQMLLFLLFLFLIRDQCQNKHFVMLLNYFSHKTSYVNAKIH